MTNQKDARVSSDYLREALDSLTAAMASMRAEIRVLSRLVAASEPTTAQPIKGDGKEADLIYGAPAIASFLGLKEKQCRHRIEAGLIPTFRMGGTICALRSQLNVWLREQAR